MTDLAWLVLVVLDVRTLVVFREVVGCLWLCQDAIAVKATTTILRKNLVRNMYVFWRDSCSFHCWVEQDVDLRQIIEDSPASDDDSYDYNDGFVIQSRGRRRD